MKNKLILIAVLMSIISGCKKFLDEKPNQKLVILSSVADLQAILEDRVIFSEQQANATEAAADNYSINQANFNSLTEYARNLYIWNKDNQFAPGSNFWSSNYIQILNANLVLDNLEKVQRSPNDQQAWNTAKGSALFIRSKCFFQLAQIWSLAYDPSNSSQNPGIPLRLNSDFNERSTRSTVEQTYTQILADLKAAEALLPVTPIHVRRASKPAALALLGRVFLSMNSIDSCLKYTTLALGYRSSLMDYNGGPGINPNAEYPFEQFNPEVIYDSQMSAPASISVGGVIDKALYESYNVNDLRKTMYHRSGTTIGFFKGSYTGSGAMFNGIATDELILMSAECLARQQKKDEALEKINQLLVKRWRKSAVYSPVTADSPREALEKILDERRKELVFRGLRWMDLKRLNLIGANITLQREINGQVYLLEPNDKRYAMAIPEDIVSISGINKNSR